MTAVVLAAVQTVNHTVVWPTNRAEVAAPTIVVAVSADHVPCVSTTVAGIKGRAAKEEVVTVRIACVDTKVPVAVAPV